MERENEQKVWILTIENQDGNPVLGVFDTSKAADAAAERFSKNLRCQVNYREYTLNHFDDLRTRTSTA